MSKQYKLLIIDNDFKTIQLLKKSLSPLDYQLYCTFNPEKALDMVKNLQIDIILLDDRVLGSSAEELLTVSKEISPNTIRILSSETPNINFVINAFNHGLICKYIPKPFKSNEIIETLEKSIDYKEYQEEKDECYNLYKELELNYKLGEVDLTSTNEKNRDSDRRRYFRVRTMIPLCCDMRIMQIKGNAVDTPFTQVCVLDTSAGGFRFLSELILPISSEVLLEFRTNILDTTLLLSGHIVRMYQVESDIYEYGVKFDIDETKETHLVRLLNEIQIDIRNNVAIRGCSFCTKENQASCLRLRIKKKQKDNITH
ncbi:PilZ domain-containing protein [Clostridium sp.]|uniref:PilZ domain-containing protein n=1 Tax=Clostridium sp. TaxID=1506 RepID=UPI002FC5FB45